MADTEPNAGWHTHNENSSSQLHKMVGTEANARLQHAQFELFLVARQRNKARRKLRSVEMAINRKTRYLASLRSLVQRNQQAMVRQHQRIQQLEKQYVVQQQLASG